MAQYECTCYDLSASVAYPRWVKTFSAASVSAAIAAAQADPDFVAGNTIGNVRLISSTLGSDAGIATSSHSSSLVSALASAAVSTGNSSTTALSASGVFTGSSEDLLQYNYLTVQAYADVASATNGLEVQFSTDGTNWDSSDRFSVIGGRGIAISVPVRARYGRVRYTNGTTAQATFRLQTVKKHIADSALLVLPERAAISTATSGDNTIISAPGAGRQILLYSVALHNPAGTDNTVILKSGSTALNGTGFVIPTTGSWVWSLEQPLVLGANEAFVINLSAATQINGFVVYRVL